MVDVSTNESKIVINVSSAGTKGQVQAQNDLAHYYEELAHEHELSAKESELRAKDWANKLGDTVDGEEYSAKHYAELTEQKHNEAIADIQDKTQECIESLENKEIELEGSLESVKNTCVEEVQTTGNIEVGNVNQASETAIINITNTKTSSLGEIETTKTNAVNSVIAEGNTQRESLQGYVNQASGYADEAHQSELYCKGVIERIGTAIKIKGRVDTFEDLPKTGNLDGDAYLVGLEGLESYPEYYWYNNHWEFLGTTGGGGTWGTITGNILEQTDLINALDTKQPVGDYVRLTGNQTITGDTTLDGNVYIYGSRAYINVETHFGHSGEPTDYAYGTGVDLFSNRSMIGTIYTGGNFIKQEKDKEALTWTLPQDKSGTIALTSDVEARADLSLSNLDELGEAKLGTQVIIRSW